MSKKKGGRLFFGIKQQQRKTCDGHFGARCQKVMSRTIMSRVGLDSPPALSATTTPGPDPPTIYSHLNLSGGHQQIVNSQEMWQTKYFKTRYREIAIFNSKFNWYLERLVVSVNNSVLLPTKKRASRHNDDYDDLTLVTIWQSGIDEGFINMIVLTRQIINQWLNYRIINASAATLMILQKKYLVQWMIALIGTQPNRRRNLSPLVTNIIAIQCPLDFHCLKKAPYQGHHHPCRLP